MNDDLIDLVSRELRRSSADTRDCPNLVLRVAAGVERRQRRHRVVGAGLTLAAVAVLTPALVLGTTTLGGSSGGSVTALRATSVAKADLALRRANPDAAPALQADDLSTCLHHASCRRPV